MQRLNGYITALGRFISWLGEKALPFFKLLKKKGPFEWTPEANKAFLDLKKYLSWPPVLVSRHQDAASRCFSTLPPLPRW